MGQEYYLKVTKIEQVTHDVKRFILEKPEDFSFVPGQGTDVSIDLPEWSEKKRPFTFTCLNEKPYLEFTIKIYTGHNGVTNELGKLEPGNKIIIRQTFGYIQYKGPGVFFAAGAGVTPFIAIFRQLYKDGNIGSNKLFFSNKTIDDIILHDEFEKILGQNFINILTREIHPDYLYGRINEGFIREYIEDFQQNFYICGPGLFVRDIKNILKSFGVSPEVIIWEK